ncbi:FAD-dependent monooxygenase [Planctomonas deserti]|uniref:FAD-dependent monooxygenase n=1 Tax=Planctomonas deserti TaxID=2144185 RepID=UPI000D34E123|nr:FAD-dependent monooxygenase [Planctomonas deserti]
MSTVSIIGGGIAGLAVAALLDPRRFDVTVSEQRVELPAVGTMLAMWPGAQRALDRIGALDEVRARGIGLASMRLRNGAGLVLAAPDADLGVIGVSRVDLLRVLDAAVPASVARVTERVTVPPANADLVIGADGVHSATRRSTWGEATRARLTPYLAVRGLLDREPEPETSGEYWGKGDLFGIGPAAGGRTNWYASFRSDAGASGIPVTDALALTAARYSDHAPAIRRVLAAATPETSLAQRVWTTPPLRRYTQGWYGRGPVALIGDAAHAMTPNLGRGACEALVDAVALADLLNSRPVDEALRAYNRDRVLRTQALRAASRALMVVALAGPAQPTRDLLARALGRRSRVAARAAALDATPVP